MQSGVCPRSLVWKNGYRRRKILLGIQNSVLNGKYININIALLKNKCLRFMACLIE